MELSSSSPVQTGTDYFNLMTCDDDCKAGSKYRSGSTSSGCARLCRSWTGVAVVCLGLLCVLLLAGIIGLTVLYRDQTLQRSQLESRYNALAASRDELVQERNRLEVSVGNLTAEKDQLQSQYSGVVAGRQQLQEEFDKLYLSATVQCNSSGWIGYNGSCYLFSTTSKNWDQARQHCQKRGTDLVIIESLEEQRFVGVFNHRSWIGLSDKDSEGKWKWVDGSDLNGAGFWQPGEPNDRRGKEDCVEVANADEKYGWNDVPCSMQLSFTCEYIKVQGRK